MSASIRRFAVLTVSTVGLLAGAAGPSHAQFVDYDTFESGAIDPDRWRGFAREGTVAGPSAELVRRVEGGRLRLSLISHGDTASDAGTTIAQQGLHLKQLGVPGGAGFITGLRTTVTITGAKAQDCAANPDATAPRVQLNGTFFNDGSSTGAGDRTGDIQVYLILLKRPSGPNQISAGIQRCQNASCNVFENLAGTAFTTTWALGAPVSVRLLWQRDQGLFRFVANGEVKEMPYPAGVADAGPPVADFKQVQVLNFVENCTSDRKKGRIDALLDGVLVRRQP
jgi:hypothetical protein